MEIERQLQHQLHHKKTDKKAIPPLPAITTKEYVTKLFGAFNDALSRTAKPALVLEAWQRSLDTHIEKYGCVIARGACEVVINYIVG